MKGLIFFRGLFASHKFFVFMDGRDSLLRKSTISFYSYFGILVVKRF